MYRFPLLGCVSRETKRLPARKINDRLGLTKYQTLPFIGANDPGYAQSSKSFFLYVIDKGEWGEGYPSKVRFMLTCDYGQLERILDQGEVENVPEDMDYLFRVFTHRWNQAPFYSSVEVVGEKIGRFRFYIPSDAFIPAY